MMAAGLWQNQPRSLGEAHVWRPRRSCYGELVQRDTSDHDWLEGRGERVRYLVRLIDDATSRSWGRFVEHDGTRENMAVLWEYLERNGRMADVYTDRAAMFAITPRAGESKEARAGESKEARAGESKEARREAGRLTQIGRALRELGIGGLRLTHPQPKVEWKGVSGPTRTAW